ncbi:MBL fold metallo-hydrolase [Aestuariibius sp. 2305UL40-4]|uniref:MBL fold metallo-hydrolase n=1 Tax=Aestuariibius violaceus TaxID=3234132 RepID=UPI00345E90C3
MAEVLHMPGHAPGQIGLWHAGSGALFGADAIHDGPPIDDRPGTSVADYRQTFLRLRDMPVGQVYDGDDPAAGHERYHAILDHYLGLWQ